MKDFYEWLQERDPELNEILGAMAGTAIGAAGGFVKDAVRGRNPLAGAWRGGKNWGKASLGMDADFNAANNRPTFMKKKMKRK
jgi:hypothetical protein